MTARRSFKMAANKSLDKPEQEDLEYEFEEPVEDIEGEEAEEPQPVIRTVIAHYPGDGAVMMLLASAGDDINFTDKLGEVMSFIASSVSSSDMRYIRAGIRSGDIGSEVLLEMMSDMVEQWTTFPTKPSSASGKSPGSTGTRSTGRSPGKGSTLPA
jgi:hypothetical protein